MTGSAPPVAETLARLRDAGRQLASRPAGEVAEALAQLLDRWSDADSPERRALAQRLPAATGLAPATVAAGLELALHAWDGRRLRALLAREGGDEPLPGITTVVHGGVIPMPAVLDLLAPLALRSAVLSRPGRHDAVTPELFAASLRELSSPLADALAVVTLARDAEEEWRTALSVERVCITGSDEAVQSVRERLGAHTRLLAHGHKLSVALLGPDESDLGAAAEALAVDVALWDQLGCLSPVACWVVGAPERARDFAAALAEALEERGRRWPRGALDLESRARSAQALAEAELRVAAGGAGAVHRGESGTVIHEPEAAPRGAPLHRFVRVHAIPETAAARAALAPLAGVLAGVAHRGFADVATAEALARSLGATRTAPFGRLQAPPLDWARDGLAVLGSLRSGGYSGSE